MGEPGPDQIEEGVRGFLADHLDLEQRLPALITEVMARQEDDHAASMLRKGGSLLVRPYDDGTAALVIGYTSDADLMAALRAATWGGTPERPPAPGSDERGMVLTLARFPISLLATVPTG
jgi:hypothetical protein